MLNSSTAFVGFTGGTSNNNSAVQDIQNWQLTSPVVFGNEQQLTPTQVLATFTDPDGNVTSYTYYGDGNVLTQTDPGGGTDIKVYDGDGDVTSETTPDGDVITSTYDPDGMFHSWMAR